MDDTTAPPTPGDAANVPTHLYVLLDRSGSMNEIRSDVIGGFNAFVAGQQENGDDARMTLVQFDSKDLAETVINDTAIDQVAPLRPEDFQPRGSTPLLDATAHLIARAKARSDERHNGGIPERVVIVTITDGLENASREFTRSDLRELVADREAEGWTFVYLSAALDAYDEARSFGYASGSVQSWAPDGDGAKLAFSSLDAAIGSMRSKARRARPIDRHDIFEGQKPAEADRHHKRGDKR
jgi:hypothetical protein